MDPRSLEATNISINTQKMFVSSFWFMNAGLCLMMEISLAFKLEENSIKTSDRSQTFSRFLRVNILLEQNSNTKNIFARMKHDFSL